MTNNCSHGGSTSFFMQLNQIIKKYPYFSGFLSNSFSPDIQNSKKVLNFRIQNLIILMNYTY